MAGIAIENIDDIRINVLPFERRYDSKGAVAVHPLVSEMYKEKGYDLAPKTAEEADARGIKNFNGLMSSIPSIRTYSENNSCIVSLDIAPTRYLIGQAMRDVVKIATYSKKEIDELSPNMANVSLIAPLKISDEYYLLSQIKGKALGSGEVHTGLVAGNIDAKYLSAENPLVSTLQNECSEEIGLDLSYMSSSSFFCMVDERETGQVNFASVATKVDLSLVLGAYEYQTRRKLAKSENLEVMALNILPIAGLALTPLEKGPGLKDIRCFVPTKDGLVERTEDRQVRPYTAATIEYLSKPENVRFLLEKAGF